MLHITVTIVMLILCDNSWVKAVLVTHFFKNTRNAHDDSRLCCVTWRCERRRPKLTAKKTEMALASLKNQADYAHVDPLLADLRTDESGELLRLCRAIVASRKDCSIGDMDIPLRRYLSTFGAVPDYLIIKCLVVILGLDHGTFVNIEMSSNRSSFTWCFRSRCSTMLPKIGMTKREFIECVAEV